MQKLKPKCVAEVGPGSFGGAQNFQDLQKHCTWRAQKTGGAVFFSILQAQMHTHLIDDVEVLNVKVIHLNENNKFTFGIIGI